jgi:Fungal specific transcription factor domain
VVLVMSRFQDPDSEDGYNLTLQFIREAVKGISSADEPTMEAVQTHLLLSMAHYGIGNGKDSSRSLGIPSCIMLWLTIGSAILLVFEMELHREPALNTRSPLSLMDRELRRRCFWTCYVLDRFLVCGSNRPMLIHDHDIKLRLPSSQDSFSQGEPIEGPFFSATAFSSSTAALGPQSAESAFIGIVAILGRATAYLQHGGVKGDTHFPWHSNSKLASLRGELAVWYSSMPNTFQQAGIERNASMTLLTISCYHLIHCLVFRDFLPVDYQRESSDTSTAAVHRTWQAETAEACISNANEIGNALQLAQTGTDAIPPFAGFCAFIAATIHLHGWHWNIPQISSGSKDYLTFELRFLLDMKRMWAGLDNLVCPHPFISRFLIERVTAFE